VTLRITRAGMALLRRRPRVRVSAWGAFTPARAEPVSEGRSFFIRR
jgi:hypothetical protein